MPDSKMQLVDWLDDLCVRFIINLPQEELESVERICFQVEEAQWFYEDFVRPLDPSLPSIPLRTFCLQMFRHCPLLASFSEYHHLLAFEEFLAYKTRVPVRGAILLNHAMDEVLLVRGWKKGANWSFPRGKINKDEKDLDCAIREVYEETGYDVQAAGLVVDESKAKFIEVSMREQHMKLYVFRGVPKDTFFQPRTRKEISKIQWYKLSQLPGYRKAKHTQAPDEQDAIKANKFYMVAPFLQPLKKWISHQRKNENRHLHVPSYSDAYPTTDAQDFDEYLTEDNTEMQRQFEQARLQHRQHSAHQPTQMNQSLLPQDLQPSNPSLPPGVDAATELKRLLSVGPSAEPVQQEPPAAGNAAQLLAMLRGSGSNLSLQEQAISQITQPQQVAEMAAPSGASEFGQAFPAQSHSQGATAAPINPAFSANGAFAPIQARRTSRQNSFQPTSPQTALQQSVESQTQKSTQQVVAPYQRTGDPEFARDVSLSNQPGPSIPAASDLPAPKLSNHAMNLLNVFKSRGPMQNAKPAAAELASSPSQQGLTEDNTQSTRPQLDQLLAGSSSNHQYSESRSRQALSQTVPRNIPSNQSNLPEASPPSKPDPQKHALLELFRRPSQPSPPAEMPSNQPKTSIADLLQGPGPVQEKPKPRPANLGPSNPVTQASPALEPSPVELSAALPSPGFQSQKKQLFDHRDGTMKEHNPQPRVSNRPFHHNKPSRDLSQPPYTSATVSGPLNNPEFSGSHRKPRSSRGKDNVPSNSISDQKQVTQSPIQILKRPTTPRDSVATKPAASPAKSPQTRGSDVLRSQLTPERASSAEQKTLQAKPFQPQILRRPPQSPAVSESVQETSQASPKPQTSLISELSVATQNEPKVQASSEIAMETRSNLSKPSSPPADRKPSGTEEQKQALLSLFAKSKSSSQSMGSDVAAVTRSSSAADNSNAVKATSKPATPLPSLNPLLTQISTNEATTQARTDDASKAGVENAPMNEPLRRDSQTPMSPGDRGFLLNYLEGFSKGHGR